MLEVHGAAPVRPLVRNLSAAELHDVSGADTEYVAILNYNNIMAQGGRTGLGEMTPESMGWTSSQVHWVLSDQNSMSHYGAYTMDVGNRHYAGYSTYPIQS